MSRKRDEHVIRDSTTREALEMFEAFAKAEHEIRQRAEYDLDAVYEWVKDPANASFDPKTLSLARLRAAFALKSEQIFDELERWTKLFNELGADLPAGLSWLSMESDADVAPLATEVIVARPVTSFKPLRLLVDPYVAPRFTLIDFRVGVMSQDLCFREIACTLFTHDNHIFGPLKIDTALPGQDVVFRVKNISPIPLKFKSALFGEKVWA